MPGVVSLLDEENSQYVRGLWEALRGEFGFSGLYPESAPHISYHVADSYDVEALEASVKTLARSMPPFDVVTNGLGVFASDDEHIVYLPVVRHPRLTVVQRTVFDEVDRHATGDTARYRPVDWVPHITLGRWDAAKNVVPDAVRFLLGHELRRSIAINNLSALEEQGEAHRTLFCYELSA
ncbi:MAG: 2'-5' RNA ligase family protein [Dehalococcoidia bacterium]|nr:2'-5' RNA ligase family protein [Dehalococcoidia bacterium]